MKLICISDTHEQHRDVKVPDGDVLIHAGDWTFHGNVEVMEDALIWMAGMPHKHKVFIAGNHDWCFQNGDKTAMKLFAANLGLIYLQDSAITLDGIKFYGSPWQPEFYDWAFNLPRGKALAEKWALIPEDTQVLITHGPPLGIADTNLRDRRFGDQDLLERINKLPKLLVHVFGHNHHGYGIYKDYERLSVNASICNERYAPVNMPIMVEI